MWNSTNCWLTTDDLFKLMWTEELFVLMWTDELLTLMWTDELLTLMKTDVNWWPVHTDVNWDALWIKNRFLPGEFAQKQTQIRQFPVDSTNSRMNSCGEGRRDIRIPCFSESCFCPPTPARVCTIVTSCQSRTHKRNKRVFFLEKGTWQPGVLFFLNPGICITFFSDLKICSTPPPHTHNGVYTTATRF